MKFFLLALIFQIKHFLADYRFQNEYMLGKFKKKGWILPLSAHCAVHALFTFLITFITLAVSLSWETNESYTFFLGAGIMALGDFVVHFIMDRIKASPFKLGKFKAINEFEYEYLKDRAKENPEYNELITERLTDNKKFWQALGIDQMVHHVTHYIIILFLL